MTLADYLGSLAGRRWQAGALDCGVFMADWARVVCGRDPIADVRGTYATEQELLAILAGEGGFEVACTRRLQAVGYRETEEPAEGDVVVVMAPIVQEGRIQRGPTGSLCVTPDLRALITSDMGVVIAPAKVLPTVKAFTYG